MKRIAQGDQHVNRSPVPSEKPSGRTVSRADLIAANERLLALRAKQSTQRSTTKNAALVAAIPSQLDCGNQPLAPQTNPTDSTNCPDHSDQTAFLASSINSAESKEKAEHTTDQPCPPPQKLTIEIYPTVATTILKSEQAAVARIWLLCRHLDVNGSGRLNVDLLREKLTKKASPLRVLGWRRLRQLMSAGQALFWERRKDAQGQDRLWLYGWRRVCQNLDIGRVSGDRVSLPIESLLGNISSVRAALYATFHTGRNATPISRATLTEITGVSERVQRDYDKKVSLNVQPNYALVAPYSAEIQRDQTYRTATPHFALIDYEGRWGAAGNRYVARQLPNSYHSNWQIKPSSQKRKLNRQLKQDLVQDGTQGNSFKFERWERVFANNARQATRSTSTMQFVHDQDGYWVALNSQGVKPTIGRIQTDQTSVPNHSQTNQQAGSNVD